MSSLSSPAACARRPARTRSTVVIPRALWERGDLLAADQRVRAAEDLGNPVEVVAEDLAHAGEVTLRYQRLIPRTNAASAHPAFLALLERHRALHNTRDPRVRAELEHAHDAWQWVIRLSPDASAEIQLAALLHDVGRLVDAGPRREDRPFDDAYAWRGGRLVEHLLADGPWDIDQVKWLVERHERSDPAPDPLLLADADALSFLAQGSASHLAREGAAATQQKVAFTLGRSSKRVSRWLRSVRLPRPVREMVESLTH